MAEFDTPTLEEIQKATQDMMRNKVSGLDCTITVEALQEAAKWLKTW